MTGEALRERFVVRRGRAEDGPDVCAVIVRAV
jgi:hypothetical protein